MKILILGGDGYLGWPLSLYLAKQGHEVTVMDSLVKCKWEMETSATPLCDVLPLHRRIAKWKELTGQDIKIFIGDATNVGAIYHVFDAAAPDAVIHLAAQPSAPFSMKNRTNAALTEQNNVSATMNALFAVQRTFRDIPFVKIGALSRGVSHSFFELSEAASASQMQFSAQNWGLRATLLEIGVVHGMGTAETALHPQLSTRFHYDEVFGTVVNRFAVQASIGHPLTVYGSGGQSVSIVSLQDTLKSVLFALEHIPEKGTMQHLACYAETLTVSELSKNLQGLSSKAGMTVGTQSLEDLRLESKRTPVSTPLPCAIPIGAPYQTLNEVWTPKAFHQILEHKDRIDTASLVQKIVWKKHG